MSAKADKKINIGLIGAGRKGKIHLKNLLRDERVQLVYIMDKDEEMAQNVKKEWNLEYTVVISSEESDLLFEDNTIDGVIIATACKDRKAWILKSLKAGKSVFCEAPFCHDVEGVIRCYEVSKKVKIPLFCAFNRRFHSTYEKIFSHLQAGKIEDIYLIKRTTTLTLASAANTKEEPADKEETIIETITQEVDLLCWLLGKFPDKVIATPTPNPTEEGHLHYDSMVVTMKFPDDTLGLIDVSRSTIPKFDQNLEVIGKAGEIIAKNPSSCDVVYVRNTGCVGVPTDNISQDPFKSSYRKELESFLDMIEGKENACISSEKVVMVAKVCQALKDSIMAERYIAPQY